MNKPENPGTNRESSILPAELLLRFVETGLDASDIAIAIADAADSNLPIVYSNAAFASLVETQELGNRPTLMEFLRQGEWEGEEDFELLPPHRNSRFELKYHRTDGVLTWKQIALCPMVEQPGHTSFLAAIVSDVTNERAALAELETTRAGLEERIRERTSALERINQDLEGFTYSVSHDLRAPLRAIMGFSKVLVEDYGREVDSEMRQTLDRINAAAARMTTIIEDLLTFSRLGRKEMIRQRIDLSDMVKAITADLVRRFPERDVALELDEGVEASGDPTLIRLAMENLIDNAFKFTSKREKGLIEFRRLGDHRFVVRDNGAGFDPKYSNKLFSPFERLHSSSDFPGTGIGLANVRRIVERHGGRIWAEGEPGQGASFYFEL